MAITAAELTAAEQSIPKESKNGDGATRGAQRGDKKDPHLEEICALAYLIVDDSRFTRATVKNVLHTLGVRRIAEAENAEQALIEIEKQSVDLLIVDFEMPGMNGAELTWRLRRSKTERTQQMPVVMISDQADESHVRQAINAGVSEFLPKPFSQADLYNRVRRAVVNPKPFIVAAGYVGPDRRLKYRDSDGKLEPRGLPPVAPVDCTVPEPKPGAAGKPTAALANSENKPRFSAMAETGLALPGEGDLVSRAADEKPKG